MTNQKKKKKSKEMDKNAFFLWTVPLRGRLGDGFCTSDRISKRSLRELGPKWDWGIYMSWAALKSSALMHILFIHT